MIDMGGRHSTGEAGLSCAVQRHGRLLQEPETVEAIDAEGWLRTGDLGKTRRGRIHFITGRLKLNSSSAAVETSHHATSMKRCFVIPGDREAAAFGVPHQTYGQDIAAAIVLRPRRDLHQDILVAWCDVNSDVSRRRPLSRRQGECPKGPSGRSELEITRPVQRPRAAGFSPQLPSRPCSAGMK